VRAVASLIIGDRKRPAIIRGVNVGTRDVECGLKVGTSIMAIGTIFVN
jgi:hypothetical protein